MKIGKKSENILSITENIILRMFLMHYVKSMTLKLVMLHGTYYIFRLIDQVLPQLHNGRKRMINIGFILRQLFQA